MNEPHAISRIRAMPSCGLRRGFTLVELLLTICILAILVALLLPGVHGAISTARSFKCQMSQRSVAFDFGLFADDTLHPWRGDDDSSDPALRVVGQNEFRMETFIDSQYGLNEFWDSNYGNTATINLPDANGRDPMRCAEVKGSVTLRRGVPCTEGAVSPPQNVSYGFNYRLQLSEHNWLAGNTSPLGLSYQVLNSGTQPPSAIPLLWDVDGFVAAAHGVAPVFSAPALDSTLLFVNNTYWFPGLRHNGGMVVGFVDGHVATTSHPLLEHGWAWGYDPTVH